MTNFWEIVDVDEVDSTNLLLYELLRSHGSGEHICVRAQFQTAGRGQLGNYWESEKGKNLTFSLTLYPESVEPKDQFIISQFISIAIKAVLSNYVDDITIKWPNDIYWKEKKIAGILIENSISGNHIDSSVIGIGINVNQEVFVSNAPNPVSLCTISKTFIDVDKLFAEILSSISKYTDIFIGSERAELRDRYLHSLYRREGFYSFSDEKGRFLARIENVQDDGCLHLIDSDGQSRKYYFKEVVFEY